MLDSKGDRVESEDEWTMAEVDEKPVRRGRFDVGILYPMPRREALDKKLGNFPGWHGCGVNYVENLRDNSIGCDSYEELDKLIALVPEDGYLTLSKK